jgi:hypothetical protein
MGPPTLLSSLYLGCKGTSVEFNHSDKIYSKLNLTRERLYRVLRQENAAVFSHIGTNELRSAVS